MQRRMRSRVDLEMPATAQLPAGQVLGSISNISLKGCYLEADPTGVEQDWNLLVTLHLKEDTPEFDVTLNGRVARIEEAGMGTEFFSLVPESFRNLLRLIQCNAEDPDAIERELSQPALKLYPAE